MQVIHELFCCGDAREPKVICHVIVAKCSREIGQKKHGYIVQVSCVSDLMSSDNILVQNGIEKGL